MKNLILNTDQFSLDNLITGRHYHKINGWSNFEMSAEDKQTLFDLAAEMLGGRKSTQERIKKNLKYQTKSYSIFQRVVFKVDDQITCQYYGGQDYIAETQTIRNILK